MLTSHCITITLLSFKNSCQTEYYIQQLFHVNCTYASPITCPGLLGLITTHETTRIHSKKPPLMHACHTSQESSQPPYANYFSTGELFEYWLLVQECKTSSYDVL